MTMAAARQITSFAFLLHLLVLNAPVSAFSSRTKVKHGYSMTPSFSNNAFHPRPVVYDKHTFILSSASEASSSDSIEVEVASNEFDWDQIAKDVFKNDKRPVILFDGVCNLCNGGVNFALDNDSVGYFRFASLQSTIGKSLLIRSGKKADDISSIVLVTEDTSYFKSDAVLRIASKLDGSRAFPIVATVGRFLPTFVKNTIYDFVATNRYRFGEAEQCRLDFGEFDDRFFKDPIVE